jgi:hypothetical protein
VQNKREIMEDMAERIIFGGMLQPAGEEAIHGKGQPAA